MKELSHFKEQINKCSKCGLCQSVCPIYKITGNECAVSKGKFVMLDGVIKGNLKLNKNINKYLEMCLKCGKCSDFCPSGIDVCKIFSTAKYDYINNHIEGFLIKLFQSKFIFDSILNIADRINFLRIPQKRYSSNKNIMFFKGCANKVFPSGEKGLRRILSKLDYNLITTNFQCCGVPFLSSGNLKRYRDAIKHNSEIINNCAHDFILTDCASCEDALKHYPELNKKILSADEFLAENNVKFSFKNYKKITFHKPCHMKNYENITKIFNNCRNIEYIEMKDFDECCGFAGQFALTNRKLSTDLSKQKAKNAIDTNADIIITTCPACILGLKQGLLQLKSTASSKPKVMTLSEFLSNADTINI